jgi:uncharacterized protein (DUF952 family)
MDTILHITTWANWEQAQAVGAYEGDTLASEGFIHCSTPDQVVEVADRVFQGRDDLVLLLITPIRVQSEIRYELAENGNTYPHIYGPLNVDAVMTVASLQPGEDGRFALPEGISAMLAD